MNPNLCIYTVHSHLLYALQFQKQFGLYFVGSTDSTEKKFLIADICDEQLYTATAAVWEKWLQFATFSVLLALWFWEVCYSPCEVYIKSR